MFSVADLMSAVAEKLTGERNLKIIFRDPAYQGADGCFYKSASGKPIIEIKPYLQDDRILFVLCHECAHAVLHPGEIVNKDVSSKPSGSMIIGDLDRVPKHEDEADKLANKWIAYANKNAHAYHEPGMREIEAKLWALLEKEVENDY